MSDARPNDALQTELDDDGSREVLDCPVPEPVHPEDIALFLASRTRAATTAGSRPRPVRLVVDGSTSADDGVASRRLIDVPVAPEPDLSAGPSTTRSPTCSTAAGPTPGSRPCSPTSRAPAGGSPSGTPT